MAVNARRYSSINSAAKDFNIAESTLRGRINGGKSQQEGDAQRQHLTESEEKALVKWIQRISITGYPPRYSTIKEMAEEMRKRRINSVNDASIQLVEYSELGQQWVRRFLNHHPHVKSTFTRVLTQFVSEKPQKKSSCIGSQLLINSSLNTTVIQRTYTTWMRVGFQSVQFKQHTLLSLTLLHLTFKHN